MRKILKPTEKAEDVFDSVVSVVRNTDLRRRLKACRPLIIAATAEFDDKVFKAELHSIIRETIINENVTSKELEDLYTLRMAKKGMPARFYYDRIILSAPHGVCPLCSHREATVVDHHLPKAEYPRLSIVPINLVPACKDCNTIKLTAYPKRPTEETIHPYYDDVEGEIWLKATVIQTTPPSIKFYAEPPGHWGPLLGDRLKHQFKELSLNRLYSIQSATELRQINYRITKLFGRLGEQGVRTYLEESIETRSHENINSWQAVLYSTIAKDDWFCSGGFALT